VPRRRGLLSGTVTFLFTDIEGSTELLKRLGRDRYESVLGEHRQLVREAVISRGGRVVDTQGDSLFCAFRSAGEALSAVIDAQRALAAHDWPEQQHVRVRMGLHSGEPKASEAGYVGIGVHRAARVGAAAHGGQVLLSDATRALVSDDLPDGVSLRDLGAHRLKDIDEPVRLYQVVADGLETRFPPPRTVRRGRVRVALVAAAVVVVAGVAAGVLVATKSASAKPVRLVANSIAVVDPKSAKAVGDVPLGFGPTDVDAGGNRIWVLNRGSRTATAIDPTTLKVVQTIGLDGDPDSQYAIAGTEWIGVPGGVEQIDEEADNNTATRISLWQPGGGSVRCLVYVTGDGKTMWVSEGTSVAVLDAASGTVLRKLQLPPSPGVPRSLTCYGLRFGGGSLFAIRNDFTIGKVDLSSKSYTPIAKDLLLNTQQNFGSANWGGGFGSYWIGSDTQNRQTGRAVHNLTRIDPVTGEVTDRIGTSVGFFNLAVDPANGVWGIGSAGAPVSYGAITRSAALVRADPETSQITLALRLHHIPCCPFGSVGNGVAVGHGRLWVGLESP
jgi:class 3 adenylate cyclase